MVKQNMSLLRTIQELEFALLELNLYLDTHPEDQNALAVFNDLASRFVTARSDYEARYGPLVNFGHSGPTASWVWIDEPWPWEIDC